MKFKCKTCQTELELLSNESEVNCSRCGRKHTTSEIRASIEEQIQNRELALSDLKQQVASMQGQVTDSSGDVKKVKEWAKYLKIAVSGYVVGYVLMFVAINRSDTWVTIASLLFTISLVCIFVFLSKISHSHIAHDGFASGEENKQYTFSAQVGFWIFASFILPMFIYGCSPEHPVEDMLANKRLHNKTHGKQYEHFVLAPCPNGSDKSPEDILRVTKEIVATVFPENMAVITVHTDTKVVHVHVVLDSVNAVTGRKFSQGPSDLNRVKQKVNDILKRHGFEIITASTNDIVDHTDYSKEDGFNFLELDESQFITEATVEEISSFTDSISLSSTNLFGGWDYPRCDNYNYGGNNMNYTPYMPQTQAMPASASKYEAVPSTVSTTQQVQEPPVSTPTIDVIPTSLPTVQPAQEMAVPVTTTETVPATVETAINCYPNTNVLTGPTFRIKGTPDSNFAGLNELVEQTAAYAQEHQCEAANLALAMNQYAQQSGYPSNVSVYAGPIFDIDMTGGIYPPLPGYDGNK